MHTNQPPAEPDVYLLGDHPFSRTPDGRLKSRIATAFPDFQTIVTVPGIHVTQRQAMVDHLEAQRRQRGEAHLREAERDAVWYRAVDLIITDGAVQIRPDPRDMALAFLADELLQRVLAKHRVRFLGVLDERVREAIKRRGELWRITALPKTAEEMRGMVAASRIGIGGREIYYYNEVAGTRYLTAAEFSQLASLGDGELRTHLAEIARHLGRRNAAGNPEVALFGVVRGLSRADFTSVDAASLAPAELRAAHERLTARFRAAVRPALRQDDPRNQEWLNAMVAALLGGENELVTEQGLLGLSPEFFMQIEWLPGGRIEDGELVLDSVLESAEGGEEIGRLIDERSRKFILNFVREYGDLEFINVGRVSGSLSRRATMPGRRGVYLAAFKQRGTPAETVAVLRLQKQGVREYLEQGLSLLEAMLRAEEYTEYVLDRRLACRQLGMNLPLRVKAHKISEPYLPDQGAATTIWTPYFEREYIRGIATDKLPPSRFESAEFALRCARLLGQAAGPNIVLGRCDRSGVPLFDDGDEILITDSEGTPVDIVVSDHTGTFNDYTGPLSGYADKYAQPVIRRAAFLPDRAAFAEAYLRAFEQRLRRLQEDYRRRRRAFDMLFHHLPAQQPGSLAYRWKRVLARLDETDPAVLAALVRRTIEGAPG